MGKFLRITVNHVCDLRGSDDRAGVLSVRLSCTSLMIRVYPDSALTSFTWGCSLDSKNNG